VDAPDYGISSPLLDTGRDVPAAGPHPPTMDRSPLSRTGWARSTMWWRPPRPEPAESWANSIVKSCSFLSTPRSSAQPCWPNTLRRRLTRAARSCCSRGFMPSSSMSAIWGWVSPTVPSTSSPAGWPSNSRPPGSTPFLRESSAGGPRTIRYVSAMNRIGPTAVGKARRGNGAHLLSRSGDRLGTRPLTAYGASATDASAV
jgi:hypothetical protein